MMRIFTILMAVILCGSLSAQTVIWGGAGDPNGEFDGGLNDWTAISVSPNEEALWFWNEDGIADDGAYAGSQAIASASAANGAASFDSDFLDNAGIQGNFGQGLAAAPQRGELLSPEFSTEGFDNITITWTQYMRQFLSTFSIEVTNDGGATWSSFPISSNNAVAVNSATPTNQTISINVTSAMANQASVQFKFVYEANYYFWTIDDVAVIETPDIDLVSIAMYYPFNQASTPASFLNNDTLEFAVDAFNNGGMDQSATTATVQILDDAGTAVYEFTQAGPGVAVGDTIEIEFDDVVLPADVNLAEGAYSVVYTVTSDDGDDATPNDNGLAENINITTDIFAVNDGLTGANSFNSGVYAATSVIRTGELPEGMEYYASFVTVTGADQNEDSIVNALGNIAVLKVLNQDGESLDPLSASAAYGVNGDHENLEPVGFGFFSAETQDNYTDNIVELLDADEEPGIVFDNNSTYLMSLEWDISNNNGFVFTGSSNRIAYFQTASLVYIFDDASNIGWYNVASTLSWYFPTVIEARSTIGTEITELDNNVVTVYPNPAFDRTTVELEFEEATDAAIILRDAMGGFISSQSVIGATKEQVQFDVSDLPAGTYSLQITTSDNARTVKSFVKVN